MLKETEDEKQQFAESRTNFLLAFNAISMGNIPFILSIYCIFLSAAI